MSSARLKMTKKCQECGCEFRPHAKEQIYCSHKCRSAVASRESRKRVKAICRVCGAEFEVKQHRFASAKYCSKKCWSHRSVVNKRQCTHCGQDFIPKESKQIYCCRKCMDKDLVGPKANAWKDGKSLERERGRLSGLLQSLRIRIFKRDQYTCQNCGTKGKLHAHHIKTWADYPDLRFEDSNLVTLCEKCHGEIHGRDFSNRRVKKCIDCGAKISGKGTTNRCRLCAQHAREDRQPKK